MNFSRKIYYNDKPLIITTHKEHYFDHTPVSELYNLYSGATAKNFADALRHLDEPEVKGAVIEDITEDALLAPLNKIYKPIIAAGGVTYDELGRILLIYRRGKWDLPKGKLDAGEDISACALREVSEETGLTHLQLDGKICDTYHIYSQNGKEYLKQTVWYRMIGLSTDGLQPQLEENIQEVRWVIETELAPYATKTYEAVREVLKAAGLRWNS